MLIAHVPNVDIFDLFQDEYDLIRDVGFKVSGRVEQGDHTRNYFTELIGGHQIAQYHLVAFDFLCDEFTWLQL